MCESVRCPLCQKIQILKEPGEVSCNACGNRLLVSRDTVSGYDVKPGGSYELNRVVLEKFSKTKSISVLAMAINLILMLLAVLLIFCIAELFLTGTWGNFQSLESEKEFSDFKMYLFIFVVVASSVGAAMGISHLVLVFMNKSLWHCPLCMTHLRIRISGLKIWPLWSEACPGCRVSFKWARGV